MSYWLLPIGVELIFLFLAEIIVRDIRWAIRHPKQSADLGRVDYELDAIKPKKRAK